MRDTLALALVRAELCRAHAAAQARRNKIESGAGFGAVIGKMIRLVRMRILGIVSGHGSLRSVRSAGSEAPPHN